MQGHYELQQPTGGQVKTAARRYAAAAGSVSLTELDVKVGSGFDGSDEAIEKEFRKQYYYFKEIEQGLRELKEEGVTVRTITMWGVIDCNSWLQSSNNVGGAASGKSRQYPLLFDDNYKVKPAFWAMVDPSKLEPEAKAVDIKQALVDDFDAANTIEFSDKGTDVTVKPIWNPGQIQFLVEVADATDDGTDAVTVYVDKYNSKSNGIKCKSVMVTRADAEATDNGYKAVVNVEVEEAEANKVVGFDIVVTNGSEQIAFNDSSLSQATSTKYFAEGSLKPFMFIPKGTITVDGELDDAWNNAAEVTLGNKTDNPQATAKVKVLWDEQNFYVYAEVTDPDLNKDNEEVHQQDSLEVFIDETNSKAAEYNNATKQYRINYNNDHSFNGETCVEENLTTVAKTTETGYIVEGAFKWTEVTPEVGANIGIELQINDADSSTMRIGTATWNDITNQCWSSPACFGSAMLVEKIDAPAAAGNSTDANTGSKKGKVGAFIGIGAAAVLAGAAFVVSTKKKPEDEEAKEEAPKAETEEKKED